MSAVLVADRMKTSAILLISCPDRKGEVATIAEMVEHKKSGGNMKDGLKIMC
jgi:formyltetrahydrofolate hydrolase